MQHVLRDFDRSDKFKFDESTLFSELCSLKPETPSMEYQAETMAFNFLEDYKSDNSWGTYFGPMMIWPNDKGQYVETPSLQLVTSEMMHYWTQRGTATQNPILKARYFGLVWDFSEKILNRKPDYTIGIQYVTALIEIAEGDYYNMPVYVFTKLNRAMELACSLNKPELIERCKIAILQFEEKNAVDESPGLWGYAFDLLENKKVALSSEEENKIISDFEARISRLMNCPNPFIAEDSVLVLLDHYNKKNRKEDIKSTLAKLTEAFETFDGNRAMQLSSWLERLNRLYTKYGMVNEAQAVLKRLREVSAGIHEEMGAHKFSMEISKDHIERYFQELVVGSPREILLRFTSMHMIDKDGLREELQKSARKHPFLYMMGTTIHDDDGRKIASIGSIQSDPDGQLMHFIAQTLSMSPFFHMGIDKLKEIDVLNTQNILNFLKNSPLEHAERLDLVTIGLDAYFEGKYTISAHLLIPQIENAIRETLEVCGGVVLRPAKKGDAFQLRTFDELLNDELLRSVLREDFLTYFRILFTEQKGLNLRNNICHGLYSSAKFSKIICDRIIHAILCIGFIQLKKPDINNN